MDWKSHYKRFLTNNDIFSRKAVLIITVGFILRLLAWAKIHPDMRVAPAFNLYNTSVFSYVGDFIGYRPLRMPFFDVLSFGSYQFFGQLVGYRALTLPTVILSCLSLPIFYLVVTEVFGKKVSTYALLLLSLSPQYILQSARGIPEMASVAIIIFSLFGVHQGLRSKRNSWFLLAGLLATLSYLMYVAAVLFAVVMAVWLYQYKTKFQNFRSIVPDSSVINFSIIPGIVGLIYLVYGPVSQATTFASRFNDSLFVNMSELGMFERLVRFVGYTYFDFWWHNGIGDFESSALKLIDTLQSFFGPLFGIYTLGWISITLLLSLVIGYGLVTILQDRNQVGILLGLWVTAYIALHIYRNWGWTGDFRTRHYFAVFPALCIAFGYGVVRIADSDYSWRPVSLPSVDVKRVLDILLIVGLVILLINAGGQALLTNDKQHVTYEEPINRLDATIPPDSTVAITNGPTKYRLFVLYSEGSIQPTIITNSSEEAMHYRYISQETTVRVIHPSQIDSLRVDYFFILQPCGQPTSLQSSYIEALLQQGGEVIYQDTRTRGRTKSCDISSILIKT